MTLDYVFIFTDHENSKSSIQLEDREDFQCYWFCLLVLPGENPGSKPLEVLDLLKELVMFQ